jgi:hypothetical protein
MRGVEVGAGLRHLGASSVVLKHGGRTLLREANISEDDDIDKMMRR